MLAEAVMLEEVLKSLLASGPLAIILGYAVATLWRTLQEERAKAAKDRDDAQAKHDAEVDKLRVECTAERNALLAKNDAQNKELVDTVKQLTGVIKSQESHGG